MVQCIILVIASYLWFIDSWCSLCNNFKFLAAAQTLPYTSHDNEYSGDVLKVIILIVHNNGTA